jgi:hypothetical protein
MRAIRTIVCWIYGLAAVVFLWKLPFQVGYYAMAIRHHHAVTLFPILGSLVNAGIGLVFATTCVSCWLKRPAAPFWGIATSAMNFVLASLILYMTWRFGVLHISTHSLVVRTVAAIAGIGILGLVGFWNWDVDAERKAAEKARTSAGDGTSPLMDKLIWVLGIAGFLTATFGWWHWGLVKGLPRRGGLPYYAALLIAEVAALVLHELGHTLTGKALGMRLRAFVVGPFQWRVRDGRWRFELRPAELFAMGGATAVVPTDPRQSRRREVWMIAGGPLASLLCGGAGLWALLEAPRHAWIREWELLALFATISLLMAVVNLLPFRTSKERYSDGAQIYQLLSGGPWGDFHHAMAIVGSGAVTPLRPRDFDIAALARAAEAMGPGTRAAHLRLLESHCYLDCGRLKDASYALNEAETACGDANAEVPLEFHEDFVFGKAFVQRDGEGTREWWKRLEAKKPKRFNADYWLARASYLWMEGRREEAREAWAQGNALAERLPEAGAYQFAREKFAMLRGELETERRMPRWHEDAAVAIQPDWRVGIELLELTMPR